MAVIVNGYAHHTLEEPIYLGNGEKVMEVWANGKKVYPEDEVLRLRIMGVYAGREKSGMVDHIGFVATDLLTGKTNRRGKDTDVNFSVSINYMCVVEFASRGKYMTWERRSDGVFVSNASSFKVLSADTLITVGGLARTGWFGENWLYTSAGGYFSGRQTMYRELGHRGLINGAYSHKNGDSSDLLFYHKFKTSDKVTLTNGRTSDLSTLSMGASLSTAGSTGGILVRGASVRCIGLAECRVKEIAISSIGSVSNAYYSLEPYGANVDVGVSIVTETGKDTGTIVSVL